MLRLPSLQLLTVDERIRKACQFSKINAASRRILLAQKSIASEVGLVCPSGEQIINGDFELGDLTGWSWSGSWPPSISSSEKHSGSYGCELEPTTLLWNTTNLAVDTRCVEEFFFWAKKKHFDPGYVLKISWYIYDYVTLIDWGDYEFAADDTWEKIDLYDAVKDADTIIRLLQIYSYGTHIAGNTIFVDDISLIGTG